jgi:hypothetical protein
VAVLGWILTRLAAASLWAAALGALAYYLVFPTVIRIGYRLRAANLDRFERQSGQGAAGSEDAVYFAARYDCRQAITRIVGTPPSAVYWMIGLYDHRLQRIPGGHLNDSTVEIQEDGRFHITVQRLPGSLCNTLECGRHCTGLILMRVFLPVDRDTVIAPTIERIPKRHPHPSTDP